MKIVLINTLYVPTLMGGAERVVQDVAEGLASVGHQVVIVSTTSGRDTRTDWINSVKVYYVGLKNLYWPYGNTEHHRACKSLWHAVDSYNPWMSREIERILSVERPTIVHTNNLAGFSALVWRRVKQQNLPLVHTLHDYYLLCPRSTMFRNGRNCKTQCSECRLYAMPRIRLSNKVNAIVGVSRSILDQHLASGYFAATARKRVIFNPYRTKVRTPPSDTRLLPIRFGYLGRLSIEKGLRVILDSVTNLPKGSWNLDIAGHGVPSYERYLRARYKAPAVRFLGHVRPETFFPQIDVLVVPSLWNEPFGRVIIEAYANGVPVIGSKRGGIPELVEEGSTGLLFNPDRWGDLPAKMKRFIDNPAMINSMQMFCLEKAKSFLPESIVEQYCDIYSGFQ